MRKDQAPLPPADGPPAPNQKPKQKKTERRRSGCLPFVVFLILMIVLVYIAVSSGGSVATRRLFSPLNIGASSSEGAVAPSPTSVPAGPAPATFAPSQPSGAIPTTCQPGIEVGKTIAVVYPAVRMRQSPGYVGKDDRTDSIHFTGTGDWVTVIGGPEMRDGLCWWLVEHVGFSGWVADHSRDGTLLLSANQ
jgi:hypothetical protein